MSQSLAEEVLETLKRSGVTECCVCTGKRNAPFIVALSERKDFKCYYWPEERSASFFALGRARRLQKPVAVITTSGTAVGALLPAMMEATYAGIPLIAVTADRPKRFRGSGAPQSANQKDIFSHYTHYSLDLEPGEVCDLTPWDIRGPLHINACFEENFLDGTKYSGAPKPAKKRTLLSPRTRLDQFLEKVEKPLVVVSTIPSEAKPAICSFLVELNAPVYLEGISGLRESLELKHLKIPDVTIASFDSVLKIGGTPTHRFWRDLEEMQIEVCAIGETGYSGLSYIKPLQTDLKPFFEAYELTTRFSKGDIQESSFPNEPLSEPSLIRALSKIIPPHSHIYLGNSLPIREWDLAATEENKCFEVTASRGVNGIDGQISTFLGLAREDRPNWAIIGDLTAIYDLAAPWVLRELPDMELQIVIINNGGGKIFDRFFRQKEFQNCHQTQFSHFAALWKMEYHLFDQTALYPLKPAKQRIIEIIPSNEATTRFWKKWTSTLSTVS